MTDLQWLFLDMNAFFASCEQQEDPLLRNRPVVVAPVDSDATCCIAASYEAKAYGIKTGTNVGTARRLCRDLVVIHARHEVYAEYHRQIMRLLRRLLPDVRKLSVDEMACPLGALYLDEAETVKLAMQIKREMAREVGSFMRCSVGIAPNAFLAKVATKLHKPNGLVVFRSCDLPDTLFGLQLADFPGIGKRMLARLFACGIHSVAQLYAADQWLLRIAWGGVVGERWWFMLRGSADCDYQALAESVTRTVSHSHVLSPEMRNAIGAEGVLLRLTARAVRRLRLKGFHARSIGIYVRHAGQSPGDVARWSQDSTRRTPAADPFTFVAAARKLWAARPDNVCQRTPTQVGVVLYDLVDSRAVTLPLFDRERRSEEAARAMDGICARFGKNAIDLGSVVFQREGSREAIAFGKVTDDGREELPHSAFEQSKGAERAGKSLLKV